ncbi:MAG: hypothetical protein AAGH89_10295 [Verrucomicrobiota bacterium]
MKAIDQLDDLPGAELVVPGLADLKAGRETAEAMLVAAGATKLRILGIALEGELPVMPEHRLYEILAAEFGNNAHSRYNAYIGRLVSFFRALALIRPLESRGVTAHAETC